MALKTLTQNIQSLVLTIVFLLAVAYPSFAQDGSKPAKWARFGFIVTWQTETKEQPIIDVKRAVGLRQQSCGSLTGVKFGDNALMRDAAKLANWPDSANRLSAAAELTDNREHAFKLLDLALEDKTLSREQQYFLLNQKMSLALRYREVEVFRGLLEGLDDGEGMPDALIADRLFLKAYALTIHAVNHADWQAIDSLLTQAVALDASFYNVIAWRVLAWLKLHGEGSSANSDCSSMVKQFSDRLMSASEASPCPMMLGHFSHFLDKQFKARSVEPLQNEREIPRQSSTWRSFGDGVLGFIAGNDAVASYSYDTLKLAASSPSPNQSCTAELSVALNQLLERQ